MNTHPAWKSLGNISPRQLAPARLQTHRAVQWVTRAARASLEAASDDSHSSLGWDETLGGLVSYDIPTKAGSLQIGMRFSDLALTIGDNGKVNETIPLHAATDKDAGERLASKLRDAGLRSDMTAPLPYTLEDAPPDLVEPYNAEATAEGRIELSKWYSNAAALLEHLHDELKEASDEHANISTVRCWPHHYDIAMLVMLDDGDPETARSVGVGLSPGDTTYPFPYFYVNPWPYPSMKPLPAAPAPGHWHTDGFMSIVMESPDILVADEQAVTVRGFLESAFRLARETAGN